MFSSNQRFEVSGDTKKQLEDCIDFAMKMANIGIISTKKSPADVTAREMFLLPLLSERQ